MIKDNDYCKICGVVLEKIGDIKTEFDPKEFTEHATLNQMGLNYCLVLDLLMVLEDHYHDYDLELDAGKLSEDSTLGELIKAIQNELK